MSMPSNGMPEPKLARQTKPEEKPSRPSFFAAYYGGAFLFMLAAFAALALLVHRPLITQIKDTNAQTQLQLQTADNERTFLKSLQASVSAAQSIQPEVLQEVDEALPSDQRVPSLLVQLGSASLRDNVRIDSIAFSPSKTPPGTIPVTGSVVPMDINLTVRATNYFEFKRFLSDLEDSLRLMDLISLVGSGGNTTESIYTLQLRTYSYLPPPAKAIVTP